MDQRREFVLRALEPGANFSALCREFRITRKTGYKWKQRFDKHGLLGLKDRPRQARGTTFKCKVEVALDAVVVKRTYPTFGPKKVRALLLRRWPADEVPSVSTVARILKHMGLTKPQRRVRRRSGGPRKSPEVVVEQANDLWTVDFKGWWKTRDGKKCEPLTIRDEYTRFVLAIDVVDSPSVACVRPVFERLFELHGLPKAIQSDNGSPFASTQSHSGLTQLSAWWVSLGVRFVRSRVGKPQDNGGHERMHQDMKKVLQRHPCWSREQQQKACDDFRQTFNWERPHESLGDGRPGSVYVNSPRVHPSQVPELVYSDGMVRRKVSKCGSIRYRGYLRSIGKALAGYWVGVEAFGENRFRVWFAEVLIGVGELPWTEPLRPPGRDQEQQALEGK